MSNITIAGNAAGTATFTVEAPATSTNRTLTLPDSAGTLATTTDSITQAQLTTALNVTGSAPIYACRAWVNFNGTGTVAIRASGNVSSITDNGTGDYTVNFTTAMQDENYCALVTSGSTMNHSTTITSTTTSAVRISITQSSTGGLSDQRIVSIAIFR